MKTFVAGALALANVATASHIPHAIAIVDADEREIQDLEHGDIVPADLLAHKGQSDIIYVPEPTAKNHSDAKKVPGKWTDEQELTLESFKEIVAADVENVWVVAYIDPRCRDCLVLSVEWEKLTQIEERDKRKVKLGYVDISVEENWKIIQDHTKGKKLTETPSVTLYGENKQSPHWYQGKPDAKGVHTWVSDYADHNGYGYWSPDQYHGAGIKGQKYDAHHHNYRTGGKYVQGNQVTQLSKDKNGLVMRKRTVTVGGKLAGLAHQKPKYGYLDTKNSYGANRYGPKTVHSGYGTSSSGRYGSN